MAPESPSERLRRMKLEAAQRKAAADHQAHLARPYFYRPQLTTEQRLRSWAEQHRATHQRPPTEAEAVAHGADLGLSREAVTAARRTWPAALVRGRGQRGPQKAPKKIPN
jgi:hypothetical protein